MTTTTHDKRMSALEDAARRPRRAGRERRKAAVAAMALCLLALGPPGAVAPAGAQSLGEGFGEAADALHLRNRPPPAADFVEQARPDHLDYQPLAPADKANHKKSASELDALAASLDSARTANQRAAQRVRSTDQPAGTKTAKAKSDAQNR